MLLHDFLHFSRYQEYLYLLGVLLSRIISIVEILGGNSIGNDKALEGRTILVIARRLSTIRDAEFILA